MNQASVTEAQVRGILREVNDPEIGRSLADLEMLREVRIGPENAVTVTVELPTPAYPRRERIAQSIGAVLSAKLPSAGPVDVRFAAKVKGKQSGGAIGLKVQNVI